VSRRYLGAVPDSYHHGDLPAALRAATAELVTERGPTGFSLREVARRAGVSHAAPAHHFGDAKGLLTSVAIEGFQKLADALTEATEGIDDAALRLTACGRAYVRTAQAFPGHFGVIFQEDMVDPTNQEWLEAGLSAYMVLYETISVVRDQLNPSLDVDTAATLSWAAMQGLVVLASKLTVVAKSTGAEVVPLDDLIERFTRITIEGMRAR